MKQFILSLVVAGFGLFACSCQHQEKSESVLFRDFNLGAIVGQMNVPQLQPTTGGSGETTAIGETTERRRDFDLEYRLDERNGEWFNNAKFLDELKFRIAEKIGDADVRTSSTGSNRESFYFNYSKDMNKGWIEVVGARVEGNRYKLWCVIRESVGTTVNR